MIKVDKLFSLGQSQTTGFERKVEKDGNTDLYMFWT